MKELIARIRIELQGIEPTIWREVDVPLSSTLTALHDVIQVSMGWRGDHLFEFSVGDKIYGEPFPDDNFEERKVYKAKSIRLQTLLVKQARDGEIDIDYPVFVGGARRCPPEDVGGSIGYEEFLEAVTDPEHEDHDRMLTWYGRPYDPNDINERHVRMIIENFASRRRGPLQSHQKGNRSRSD
jgi:hypothetical protein